MNLTLLRVVGYHWNRLDEPIFMSGPKPMRTGFGICQRLESCEVLLCQFSVAFSALTTYFWDKRKGSAPTSVHGLHLFGPWQQEQCWHVTHILWHPKDHDLAEKKVARVNIYNGLWQLLRREAITQALQRKWCICVVISKTYLIKS